MTKTTSIWKNASRGLKPLLLTGASLFLGVQGVGAVSVSTGGSVGIEFNLLTLEQVAQGIFIFIGPINPEGNVRTVDFEFVDCLLGCRGPNLIGPYSGVVNTFAFANAPPPEQSSIPVHAGLVSYEFFNFSSIPVTISGNVSSLFSSSVSNLGNNESGLAMSSFEAEGVDNFGQTFLLLTGSTRTEDGEKGSSVNQNWMVTIPGITIDLDGNEVPGNASIFARLDNAVFARSVPVPEPEPLTILGLGVVLGLEAFFKKTCFRKRE